MRGCFRFELSQPLVADFFSTQDRRFRTVGFTCRETSSVVTEHRVVADSTNYEGDLRQSEPALDCLQVDDVGQDSSKNGPYADGNGGI